MYCNKLVIRPTTSNDRETIHRTVTEAFGRTAEAEVTLKLIDGPQRTLSLIGEQGGRAVGYILLTELSGPVRSVALAPLGVVPSARELQVGSQLVRNSVCWSRDQGYEAMFVLGEPAYYERFGFSALLSATFEAPWRGPRFMALELSEGSLSDRSGRIEFPASFFR